MKKTLFVASLLAAVVCYSTTAQAEGTTKTIDAGQTETYSDEAFAGYTAIDVYGTLNVNNQAISSPITQITLRSDAHLTNTGTAGWGDQPTIGAKVLLEGDAQVNGNGTNIGGEVDLNGHTLTITGMNNAGVYFRSGSSLTGAGTISVESRTLQFRDSAISDDSATLNIGNATAEIRSASATTLAGVTGTTASGILTAGDLNGDNVLNLAGDGTYDYAGTIKNNAQDANRRIVINHTGEGTQTFSGTIQGGTINGQADAKEKTVISGTITGGTVNNALITGTLAGGTVTNSILGENVTVTGNTTLSNLSGAYSVTVNEGTTLSANGTQTEIILAGGSTLKAANTGNFNAQQLGTLTLTGNATIDLSADKYGLINRNGNNFATATLNMGDNNTLTLTGSNRFCLMDVTTTGTGTIQMGSYLQVAHSGVSGHTADLSGVVVSMNNTHLVISHGSTLIVNGLSVADNATNCAIEADGDPGSIRDLKIVGDGSYKYRGGFATGDVKLSMTGSGTQEFNLSNNSSLDSISATNGTLKFTGQSNKKTVNITNGLTISEDAKLFVGENIGMTTTVADNSVAGTLEVAGDLLVTADDGTTVTVHNLVLEDGARVTVGTADTHTNRTLALTTLTVSGTNVTTTVNADLDLTNAFVTLGNNVVTLGCDLNLTGTNISLETDDIYTLVGMFQDIDLFTGVDSVTLNGTEYSASEGFLLTLSEADIHVVTGTVGNFETIDFGDDTNVYVKYSNGTVSLTAVPEPATATLSLLALAGLAARRRR